MTTHDDDRLRQVEPRPGGYQPALVWEPRPAPAADANKIPNYEKLSFEQKRIEQMKRRGFLK